MGSNEERIWKRGDVLGKGGFGTVYLATGVSSSLPPVMAVKSVEIKQGDVSSATSLVQESHFLSHLHPSPHIIGFYGEEVTLDQETGQFHFNLLLEYACLGTLGDRIQENSSMCGHVTGLLESEVKRYTRSILQGLHHIHQHKLVHCDIKPDNILLSLPSPTSDSDHCSYHAIPKIADFGLAKFAGEELIMDTSIRGTALYMAPESVRYNQYEPPCDVWALGCVVLEMLTGKSAWRCNRDTPLSHILHRIGYSEELPVIPSTISAEAQHFLKNCLVKDTTLRWTPEMLLKHPFLDTQNSPLSQMVDFNFCERIDYMPGDYICNGWISASTCSTSFHCTEMDPDILLISEEENFEGSAHGPSFISLQVTDNTEKQKRKWSFDKIGSILFECAKRMKTPHEVHEVTRSSLVPADTRYADRPWIIEPCPFINTVLV